MNQSNDIRESIKLITQLINTEEYVELLKEDRMKYQEKVRSIFPTFAQEYPQLFKKVVLKGDLSMLDTMLQSIDDIRDGCRTRH